MLFLVSLIENWISKICLKLVHFSNLVKAILSGLEWAHGKYFTDLDVAAPAHPSCGLWAYSTLLLSLKWYTTGLIMVLGIRAHGVRSQLKVNVWWNKVNFYQDNCTICQTTRWMCWGCNIEIGEVFPVCSHEIGRKCFTQIHNLRRDFWDSVFYQTYQKKHYQYHAQLLNKQNLMFLWRFIWIEIILQ